MTVKKKKKAPCSKGKQIKIYTPQKAAHRLIFVLVNLSYLKLEQLKSGGLTWTHHSHCPDAARGLQQSLS